MLNKYVQSKRINRHTVLLKSINIWFTVLYTNILLINNNENILQV